MEGCITSSPIRENVRKSLLMRSIFVEIEEHLSSLRGGLKRLYPVHLFYSLAS